MNYKKILAGLSVLAICLSGFSQFEGFDMISDIISAESSAENENLEYEVKEDGTVSITGYTGSEKELIIPETIDGKTVTSIGDSAFYECETLTSVTLPESITSIGRLAFYYCPNLADVTIPESVISIGGFAFTDTPWLEKQKEENPLVIVNNVLIDGTLCQGTVTVPDSVTEISGGAFADCRELTGITLPDGISCIDSNTFCNCNKLSSITIPDSVTYIGGFAFINCEKLTSVTIPENVTFIGFGAFRGCSSLAEITIPDNVSYIDDFAFYGCKSLTSISIPKSVTEIRNAMLSHCENLTSVTIPEGVTSIGYSAFDWCSSLTEITIPESVNAVGGDVFRKTPWLEKQKEENPLVIVNNILIDGTSCKGDVTIPEGVISICPGAFINCHDISSITVPDSVTEMDYIAFSEYYTEKWTPVIICHYNSYAHKFAEAYDFDFKFTGSVPDTVVTIDDYNYDIDDNGIVSISDLTKLIKYIAGINESISASAADINTDGKVDGRDIMLLEKIIYK